MNLFVVAIQIMFILLESLQAKSFHVHRNLYHKDLRPFRLAIPLYITFPSPHLHQCHLHGSIDQAQIYSRNKEETLSQNRCTPQKLTWNSKIYKGLENEIPFKVWDFQVPRSFFGVCNFHDVGHEVTNVGCWVTDTHGGLHRHIWKLNMDYCKNPTWKPSFSGEPLSYGRVQSREL